MTVPTTHGDGGEGGEQGPVVVSLKSLTGNLLPRETLTSAFGPESLGIILVKDLPPHFTSLRSRLLQYASYLAHLPSEELSRVTVPEAKYLTGWSHGVETLKSGKKDSFKGSWYSNCSFYHDRHSAIREGAWGNGNIDAKIAEIACQSEQLEERERRSSSNSPQNAANGGGAKPISNGIGAGAAVSSKLSKFSAVQAIHGDQYYHDFPEYTNPNVWPREELLPGFQKTLEDMCCLIIDVAVLVAKQCDRFAKETNIEGYEPGYLERVVSTSRTTKARLLHYFPPDATNDSTANNSQVPSEDIDEDDWCTTHKDHGCLTGLTSALFIDESEPLPKLASLERSGSGEVVLPDLKVLKASPDPSAGLYIRSRTGALTKVAIPPDCLAFQTGEALERVTRGKFAAVPHFVRGPKVGGLAAAQKVARNTLAVFTQPNLSEPVDDQGTTFAEFAREIVGKNTVS